MSNRVTIAHHLPAIRDPLVGRDLDADALRSMLGDPAVSLVTISGPGGVGKTTLTLFVANQMLQNFPDGVYFVDLTSLNDPNLILDEIAQTARIEGEPGVSPAELLEERFARRQVLLILDNFEHLLEGALALLDLLQRCKRLKALVTSRQPLHLRAERIYPLAPLALPEGNGPVEVSALAHVAAVNLFVRRVQEVRPDFQLKASNAAAVAALVARLDGMPLAIELAAARARLFSVAALLARLEASPLGLLSGGARDLPARQQTVRSTIAWSYELLLPPEARLLRRLAVFAGGFDLAAAEAVGLIPFDEVTVDALAVLESLLDKSLIIRLPHEKEPRFDLLETLRAFALEQLQHVDEEEQARRAHFEQYLRLAEEAAPHLRGAEQRVWLDRLEAEDDNLRGALRWALQGAAADPERAALALQLAGALGDYWMFAGQHLQGQRWLAQVMGHSKAAAGGATMPELTRSDLFVEARAWSAAGTMAWLQSDFARGVACHRQAMALYAAAEYETMAAQARHDLAANYSALGMREEALALSRQNVAYFRQTGDWLRLANALNSQALIVQAQGDLPSAIADFEEGYAYAQRLGEGEGAWLSPGILANLGQAELVAGNLPRAETLLVRVQHESQFDDASPWGVDVTLALGRLREAQGRLAEARELALEALRHAAANHYRDYIADALEQLGFLAARAGAAARGGQLLGAAAAMRERLGAADARDQEAYFAAELPLVRDALPEKVFARAWEAGHLLDREEAVALAQEALPTAEEKGEGARAAAVREEDPLAALTPRERVVALLMVHGRTNKQIAAELFITVKTVEKHAGNVLGKLGMQNRVELTGWAAANGLLDGQ